MKIRRGFYKDENGNMVGKWCKRDEDYTPDLLFQVPMMAEGGKFADKDKLDAVKEELVEEMISRIREVAKNDEFWIVKTVDETWENFKASPVWEMHNKPSKEEWLVKAGAKEDQLVVAWHLEFPTYDGYYPLEVADRLNKSLGI